VALSKHGQNKTTCLKPVIILWCRSYTINFETSHSSSIFPP